MLQFDPAVTDRARELGLKPSTVGLIWSYRRNHAVYRFGPWSWGLWLRTIPKNGKK